MKLPWFRLYHESRNDRKLDTLADDEFRVWHKLLCMASEQEERGIIAYDDMELLAIEVARGDVTLLSRCVTRLIALRIVTNDGHAIEFVNFLKRNYDKPSETPEATRERKRKSRANAKEFTADTDMSRDVTPGHAASRTRGEESREEEIREEELTGAFVADATPPLDSEMANEPIPIKRATRSTRIPAEFPLTEQMRRWAAERVPNLDLQDAHEEFCTFWRGDGGTKADWYATWQNGMLKANKLQRGYTGSRFVSQAEINKGVRGKFVGA